MPPRLRLPTFTAAVRAPASAPRRTNATLSIPRNTPVHPRTGGNPLTSRVANRALPDIARSRLLRLSTIPIFIVAVAGSAWGIFNYQKLSSSVVASTLYSLRVHPRARAELGDEIAFASAFPIVWGGIDQLHGVIDIQYSVKGRKGVEGVVRFRSTRKGRRGVFATEEWYLTMQDGRKLILLEDAPVLPKSD
ncbi:cytochrome oxidase complex assembly protein 1-domain-containing protein [Tricharina praecox]|uniref:cytochrome oxidase complex assembly protein 1-domain-containing protein n=1 Tax=Tricharina praecox TaxID=43433 RepID=UPI002220E316|nr:cytochrome oxidase complex assembly protein 1-domain-containing protein [Tricharina praecox]KAI5857100.1 cytochrome oxidase complex assembly protein 1-domain-containing protein [Tricharina praecox]